MKHRSDIKIKKNPEYITHPNLNPNLNKWHNKRNRSIKNKHNNPKFLSLRQKNNQKVKKINHQSQNNIPNT